MWGVELDWSVVWGFDGDGFTLCYCDLWGGNVGACCGALELA